MPDREEGPEGDLWGRLHRHCIILLRDRSGRSSTARGPLVASEGTNEYDWAVSVQGGNRAGCNAPQSLRPTTVSWLRTADSFLGEMMGRTSRYTNHTREESPLSDGSVIDADTLLGSVVDLFPHSESPCGAGSRAPRRLAVSSTLPQDFQTGRWPLGAAASDWSYHRILPHEMSPRRSPRSARRHERGDTSSEFSRSRGSASEEATFVSP